ncbi:hypothetical protein K378_03785 [Streptomyces sp. Amel2xB2]|uniref:hypothetical protein n=1 Tax=Streptomyces sp. Amel2xB2 TaxID=1305829 RepID=UPI000DB9BFF7|nr:hypothetical protein [Streptomyces sp. Amel2xB2]RAJ62434.1 hypothetical protein K378_03785 [Streptomyces sp. Amel2xB2]
MSVTMLESAQHVPLRPDVERWATRHVRKRVLAVVHTVTAGQRLLEAVRLLEGDPRVQVFFTAAPDVFSNGVPEFLADTDGLVLPWNHAVRTEFDLAVAAAHDALHELHAPVIVLPHGAGHNKLVSAGGSGHPTRRTSGGGRRARAAAPVPERNVYGLSRQWLVRDGVVVPRAIALGHEDERERLGRECPEALSATEVVGDPCYDRMTASFSSRALYRQALGVSPEQSLILACSTWGGASLIARDWELLERLVSELPPERYRTALMLHPHVWNTHSPWTVRSWFAALSRAGLVLLSHRADWCGAMVSANFVVGDHGSVSLYGAMTGVPVLSAGAQQPDGPGLDPDSPLAELRSFTPRLRPDRPLRRQLTRSAATYRADRHESVAARITSEPGRYVRRMRALLYRTLGLRPPAARPVMGPAPLPVVVDCDGGGGW